MEREGGLRQDGEVEGGRPEGRRDEAGSSRAEGRDRFTRVCSKRRGHLYFPAGCSCRGERGCSLRQGPVDEGARDDLRGGCACRRGRAAEIVISGQ